MSDARPGRGAPSQRDARATLAPVADRRGARRSRDRARGGGACALYELRDVPRLTDETDEVMRGLAIARAELLPLTNVDAYIGPLWNYLLALGFLIVGPSSLLPRVLTMLAGRSRRSRRRPGSAASLRFGWAAPDRTAMLGLGGRAAAGHVVVSRHRELAARLVARPDAARR